MNTFPNTEKRVENKTHGGGFLADFEMFGYIADETLSGVFDISSQSKLNLRKNLRNKIVKISANYKIWYSNIVPVMFLFRL